MWGWLANPAIWRAFLQMTGGYFINDASRAVGRVIPNNPNPNAPGDQQPWYVKLITIAAISILIGFAINLFFKNSRR